MLSIVDRFLGSLVAAAIGQQLGGVPSPMVGVKTTMALPAMLPSSQLSLRALKTDFWFILPWLLAHHDNDRVRHLWLWRQLTSDDTSGDTALVDRLRSLYLLGDCLEWFMQASPHMSQPEIALRQYLKDKSVSYPTDVRSWVMQDLQNFGSPGLCPPSAAVNGRDWVDVVTAIQHCLQHRENLALALQALPVTGAVSLWTGGMLGAWAGMAVIPMQWQLSLPAEAMAGLTSVAIESYRAWAGVVGDVHDGGVLPLDL